MPGFARAAHDLPLGAARAELDPGHDGDGHEQPGENRKCMAKLTMTRATLAVKARTMIQGMVIGLRS